MPSTSPQIHPLLILEDINLEEIELETINTDDLVDLFPKEDCWLTIDQTGKTDDVNSTTLQPHPLQSPGLYP